MNDNYAQKRAWDLNKQVYPRKVRCNNEEIESFFFRGHTGLGRKIAGLTYHQLKGRKFFLGAP